ncbi:MAG: DUF3313 domain-containing protein [Rhodanobacteraceae bacterium]
MHCKTIRSWAWILVASLVLTPAVCMAAKVKSARTSGPAAYSGFLKDYSLLQANPDEPGYLHYVAPGINPAQYRKFIIEAPQIIINTGGEYQALDPARLSEITTYYEQAMASALRTHYEVVSDPGPGVARIRVAVVGAVEVNEPLKPRNLLPVSALFKVARAATGTNAQVLRMSIESEALDSESGAVLGETVDSRESTKTVLKGESAKPAQLHQLIDFWVARFVARLDKANGFTN